MRAWSWVALVVLAGCGQSVPTFPVYGRDAGHECGDDLGDCPAGEVCLERFCYERCSDSSPCGPLEECSSAGACVPRTSDAGMPDAAPPDPCDDVPCEAPTAECRAGVCLACDENNTVPPQCGGATPICDVGRGTCVAFVNALCAPCASDLDCASTATPSTCVVRTATAEQVCLPTSADGTTCPAGFRVATDGATCEPSQGTCTGMRAALERRSCSTDGVTPSDAACAPAGATPTTGLFTGVCFAASGGELICHHPCSAIEPCPDGLACDTTLGFCL